MVARELIVDPATLDLETVVADLEAIRRWNPQRYEMEQLTAIVVDEPERGLVVGYKDTSEADFWVRGHMPGRPLMPGVMMCEAAAQLCSYHALRHQLMESGLIGFGGLDEVRFRGPVAPGDRLVIASQRLKLRPKAMIVCRFQCFVKTALVCEGMIRGVPLPIADQA